jgi:hypothetical protein
MDLNTLPLTQAARALTCGYAHPHAQCCVVMPTIFPFTARSPTPAVAAPPLLTSPSESTTKVPANSAIRRGEQTEQHGVKTNGGDPAEADLARLPVRQRPNAVPPLC